MAILDRWKVADTVSGQKDLVEMVAKRCNLSESFNPAEQEKIERIIIYMKHGLPYFSVSLFYIHVSLLLNNKICRFHS